MKSESIVESVFNCPEQKAAGISGILSNLTSSFSIVMMPVVMIIGPLVGAYYQAKYGIWKPVPEAKAQGLPIRFKRLANHASPLCKSADETASELRSAYEYIVPCWRQGIDKSRFTH